MTCTTTHRQIRVEGLLVDEEIAWLLRSLWRRGFATSESCQGDEESSAYLRFRMLGQGLRFVDGTVDRLFHQGVASAAEVEELGLRLTPVATHNDRIGATVQIRSAALAKVASLWTC